MRRLLFVLGLLFAFPAAAQVISPATAPTGNPNLLINGAQIWDQRTEGGAGTTTDANYTTDGWKVRKVLTTATLSATVRINNDAVGNFSQALKYTIGTGASLSSGDLLAIQQNIEGSFLTTYNMGTSTVTTFSFQTWVKSSVSNAVVSFAFLNNAKNRSYFFECTLNGTAWTFCQKSFQGDTTGTWVTGPNTIGMRVFAMLACASNLQGTANAWTGSEVYCSSNTTNIAATSSATYELTGTKLEAGPTPTPFVFLDTATDLNLMRRYFQKTFALGTAPAQSAGLAGSLCFSPSVTTTGTGGAFWQFNPPMVKAPTITTYNPSAANAKWRDIAGAADKTQSVDAGTAIGTNGVFINTTTDALTVGNQTCIHARAESSF
jgi:hypothetical protein